jgi:hypothetical protein
MRRIIGGSFLDHLQDAVHLDTLKDVGATTDPANFDAVDPLPLAEPKWGYIP